MRNGGGAIMAMGRGTGEHRVEKAILDALDSPLLYGNDIGKARRILFNIYASDEHPIFVREMQEIDDFFDQLDPNIDVIWGTSTDDSLGEDAKVTILATGLEDELRKEVNVDVHQNEEAMYEDLIPLLYKPNKKKGGTTVEPEVPKVEDGMAAAEQVPFEVEVAKEPEVAPAVVEEEVKPVVAEQKTVVSSQEEAGEKPAMVNKWRKWLNDLVRDVNE